LARRLSPAPMGRLPVCSAHRPGHPEVRHREPEAVPGTHRTTGVRRRPAILSAGCTFDNRGDQTRALPSGSHNSAAVRHSHRASHRQATRNHHATRRRRKVTAHQRQSHPVPHGAI
jgi:hypothetical protein